MVVREEIVASLYFQGLLVKNPLYITRFRGSFCKIGSMFFLVGGGGTISNERVLQDYFVETVL